MEQKIKNAFCRLIKQAWYESQACYGYVLCHTANYPVLLSHTSNINSYYAGATAMYYSNLEVLNDTKVKSLLHQFQTFASEVSSTVCKDGSHQWSSIEFEKLEELYNNSIYSQPIPEEDDD